MTNEPADVWDYPTDDVIASQLRELALAVESGEAAKRDRAHLIRLARNKNPQVWTQERLAEDAGITQQAVAKTLARKGGDDALATRSDVPYLVGRLLGVVDRVSGLNGAATKLADKMIEGRWPINDETVGQVRTLLTKDLARDQQAERYRAVLDDVDDRLGETGTIVLSDAIHVAMFLGYDHQRAALMGL